LYKEQISPYYRIIFVSIVFSRKAFKNQAGLIMWRLLISIFVILLLGGFQTNVAQVAPVLSKILGENIIVPPGDINVSDKNQAFSKLGSELRVLMHLDEMQPHRFIGQRFPVFIFTDDMKSLANAGVHINSSVSGIASARLTVGQIRTVAQLDSTRRITLTDSGEQTDSWHHVESGIWHVHNAMLGNQAYTGKNVIVAIIDDEFDYDHPDFWIDTGSELKTRILYLIDPTLTPEGGESHPPGWDYGVIYSRADLESDRNNSTSIVRSAIQTGHGTQVASIAAGDDSRFMGSAPDADIVLIKFKESGIIQNTIVMDALDYLNQLKIDTGKPVVANLSYSGKDSARDGTHPVEKKIDEVSGVGFAVTVSAGNDAHLNRQITGTITDSTPAEETIQIDPYTRSASDAITWQFYVDDREDVTLELFRPNDSVTPYTLNAANPNTALVTDDGILDLEYTFDGTASTGLFELTMYSFTGYEKVAEGEWLARLSIPESTAPVTYHSWISRISATSLADNTTLIGGTNSFGVGYPGTAQKAITIGNHKSAPFHVRINNTATTSTLDRGEIDPNSSLGPTRDGRTKPELSAHANLYVRAAAEGFGTMPGANHSVTTSGATSFSAPVVAGAIGLLLQADSSLSSDQIKTLLTDAAISDSFTGITPNNTWGFGKLEVAGALSTLISNELNPQRSHVSYFGEALNASTVTTLNENESAALRITPTETAFINGIHTYVRDISGSGTLNIQLLSSNSGIPDAPLSAVKKFELSDFQSRALHFLDIPELGFTGAMNDDFFLHFEMEGTGAFLEWIVADQPVEAERFYIDDGGWVLSSYQPVIEVEQSMGLFEVRHKAVMNGGEGYRYLTTPVNGVSLDEMLRPLWTQGFTGSDGGNTGTSNVYFYDEPTGSWNKPTSISQTINRGTGFIMYAFDDDDFDGEPDDWPKFITVYGDSDETNVELSLSKDNPDTDNNWHLVGNPYPFPIDWDLVDAAIDRPGISDAIYLWDSSLNNGNGAYRYYNGVPYGTGSMEKQDGILSPFQAFLVNVNGDEATTLTFRPAHKALELPVLFSEPEYTQPFLIIQAQNTHFEDQAVFTFTPYGSLQKDRGDAFKLPPLNGIDFSLFSFSDDGYPLAINNLPVQSPFPVDVSLDLSSAMNEPMILTWEGTQHLPWADWQFILTDQLTGIEYDLSRSGSVEVDVEEGLGVFALDDANKPNIPFVKPVNSQKTSSRFILTIQPGVHTSLPEEPAGPVSFSVGAAYPNPFNPTVQIPIELASTMHVRIEVFDMLGRKVATLTDKSFDSGFYSVKWDASRFASGIYLIRSKVESQNDSENTRIQTQKITLLK